MNKQDYLIKKGLIPHPDNVMTVYFFESKKEGVSEIKEISSIEIRKSEGNTYSKEHGDRKVNYLTLRFDKSPYELTFRDGETSAQKDGYGSGWGDLWGWSQFGFFNKEDAETARVIEHERVSRKYFNGNNMLECIDVIFQAKSQQQLVDEYARMLYKEKFKDHKKGVDEFHYYSGFEVISKNKIKVKYNFGSGMYDYNDSFEVEIKD
jgi:hypothetical protein